MSRNNEKVENKKLFKSIELEIEENFKSEVDKRYNIYNHLKNNAAEIVSKASDEFLAENPKLIAKGGIIYHFRDMTAFLRDMDWLLKIVVYSIFQKVQPTQLSVFKSVLEEVVKDSAIKKLSKQDTTFAIETLEKTARSSLNEEPVVDSDFIELLKEYFGSLKDFFFKFSFDEESLDAGEENTENSPDQDSKKKVMEENLMQLSKDEFMKRMCSLHSRILRESWQAKRFLSTEEFAKYSYTVETARLRGELKTPEDEEKMFSDLKKEFPILREKSSEEDYPNEEVKKQFTDLMIERIQGQRT